MTTDKKASSKFAPSDKDSSDSGKSAERKTPASAADFLKAQHREVEAILSKRAQSSPRHRELIHELAAAWIPHTVLEEDVLEPEALSAGADKQTFQQAAVRRDLVKLLLEDLLRRSSSETATAKLEVLAAEIAALIAEEEKPEDGLIAKATAAGVDMNALGQKMQQRHAELQRDEEDVFERLATRSLRPTKASRHSQQESESMARYSQSRERDEQGRFVSDDDDRGYRGRGSRSSGRERDEYGRFMSDDDDDRGYSARGRYDEADDDRYYRSASRNGNRNMMRDDEGRFTSSRGRDYEDDDRRGWRSSRYDMDEGDDRGRGRGWYGDPEGHSRAAQRAWDDRDSRYAGYDDDDYRRRSTRSRDDDDDRGRGWFGDSRGHAEAARRGWEDRDRGSSRDREGSSRGRSHGGWFGDSRGHAEAARRGWEDRR